MKKTLLLALFTVILYAGCTKNYYTPVPRFIVENLVDFSINANMQFYVTTISIKHNQGEQEHVSLSVEGLPDGLSYRFVSDSSGIAPLTTNIYYQDSSAKIGTYKVNLVVEGSSSGTVRYPFTITVDPIPECTDGLIGQYLCGDACVGPNFNDNVTKDPLVPNRIYFNNFNNRGIRLYADIYCRTSSNLIVPSQVINGDVYSGSGYYYYDNGKVNLSIFYTRNGSGSCRVFAVK